MLLLDINRCKPHQVIVLTTVSTQHVNLRNTALLASAMLASIIVIAYLNAEVFPKGLIQKLCKVKPFEHQHSVTS